MTDYKTLNIDWDFFRQEIDIEEVADLLGIERTKNNFFLCPSHGDSRPSAQIRPKSNSWCCYTCGAGGSCLDLVQAINGGELIDAALYLNKYFPGGIRQKNPNEQSLDEEIPDIDKDLLKKIGLKRNPFIPIKVRDVLNEKDDKLTSKLSTYTISKTDAAEIVLEKAKEFREIMKCFDEEYGKEFIRTDVDEETKKINEELFHTIRQNIAEVSCLIYDMNEYLAMQKKDYHLQNLKGEEYSEK